MTPHDRLITAIIAATEDAAALVALALLCGTFFVWAVILGGLA